MLQIRFLINLLCFPRKGWLTGSLLGNLQSLVSSSKYCQGGRWATLAWWQWHDRADGGQRLLACTVQAGQLSRVKAAAVAFLPMGSANLGKVN